MPEISAGTPRAGAAFLPGGLDGCPRPRRCGYFPAADRRFLCASAHAPARGGACDALGRFAERGRGHPFDACQPGGQNPDAAPGRVRADPVLVRLREGLGGGRDGRRDALPAGGGDSVAVGYGQGGFREVSGAPRKPGKPEFAGGFLHGHQTFWETSARSRSQVSGGSRLRCVRSLIDVYAERTNCPLQHGRRVFRRVSSAESSKSGGFRKVLARTSGFPLHRLALPSMP
jgi:hypothetical protein